MSALPGWFGSGCWRRLVWALAALAAAGCGGGLAPVQGRVLVGGRPVPAGVIMFQPDSGPTAVGEIKPDGSYSLRTEAADGAVIGRHKVLIQATSVGPGSLVRFSSIEDELNSGNKGAPMLVPGAVTWLAPEKYSQAHTTPLTAEVKPGRNELVFDIPPAP